MVWLSQTVFAQRVFGQAKSIAICANMQQRIGAIRSDFTIEKGFRGQHFEQISGFEGTFKAELRDTFPI